MCIVHAGFRQIHFWMSDVKDFHGHKSHVTMYTESTTFTALDDIQPHEIIFVLMQHDEHTKCEECSISTPLRLARTTKHHSKKHRDSSRPCRYCQQTQLSESNASSVADAARSAASALCTSSPSYTMPACAVIFKVGRDQLVKSDSEYLKVFLGNDYTQICPSCQAGTLLFQGREREAAYYMLSFLNTNMLPKHGGDVPDGMLLMWMLKVRLKVLQNSSDLYLQLLVSMPTTWMR